MNEFTVGMIAGMSLMSLPLGLIIYFMYENNRSKDAIIGILEKRTFKPIGQIPRNIQSPTLN